MVIRFSVGLLFLYDNHPAPETTPPTSVGLPISLPESVSSTSLDPRSAPRGSAKIAP